MLHIAASSVGPVVAAIQAGSAAADGLTTIGTLAPSTTRRHTLELGGAISARYLKTTCTATGGTAIFAADVIAMARTITD